MKCSVHGHIISCNDFEFAWNTCASIWLIFHSLVCSGGVDDVGQLRAGLQSSHWLDPASGEAGEHRCREQVTISSFGMPVLQFILYLQWSWMSLCWLLGFLWVKGMNWYLKVYLWMYCPLFISSKSLLPLFGPETEGMLVISEISWNLNCIKWRQVNLTLHCKSEKPSIYMICLSETLDCVCSRLPLSPSLDQPL